MRAFAGLLEKGEDAGQGRGWNRRGGECEDGVEGEVKEEPVEIARGVGEEGGDLCV